jgi:predicted RNA-binding Zn-ribbon protein involved in translation (DUF1610 family)
MNWHLVDLVLPNARRNVRAVVDRLDPVLTRLRGVPRRTLAFGGAAVLLLLVALVVSVRSGPEGDVPTGEFIGFYCPACDHYFELSHRQFKQLWDQHEFKRAEGRQALVFKCSQCGKLTAVRADQRRAGVPPASRAAKPG